MSDRPDDITGLERLEQFMDGWGDEVIGLKAHPKGEYVKYDAIKRAIDQARREGYAAGVRAAAEVMGRLSKEVEDIDSFYRTAGELHMADIGAAAIRALDGKGGGV